MYIGVCDKAEKNKMYTVFIWQINDFITMKSALLKSTLSEKTKNKKQKTTKKKQTNKQKKKPQKTASFSGKVSNTEINN